MGGWRWALLLAAWGGPLFAAPLDHDPGQLRPGLPAHYQSLAEKSAALQRIDGKPSFALGNSSPHPRLPPGPFEVTWTGAVQIADRGPVTFSAFVCGEVTVEIDGVVVLEGRGESETARLTGKKKLDREPGLYPLKIHYRSPEGKPARLQLWWEGEAFSREPLPAWRLKHLASEVPRAATREAQAEQGRRAVERLGCARCHSSAFPDVTAAGPGPSLADVGGRVSRAWLMNWLEDPGKVRGDAHMPALFSSDRAGFVERWLVADHLLGPQGERPATREPPGDHRMGRRMFVGLGCAACHLLPDGDEKPAPGRSALRGLGDRMSADDLAAFLGNPHGRYPDGRMPRLPIPPETARDLAAFLLLWSKPTTPTEVKPPSDDEVREAAKRLGVRNAKEAGAALVRQKRCAECHPGLGQSTPSDVPIRDGAGCLAGKTLPRFRLDDDTRQALEAYRKVAPQDRHPSPFAARQRLLDHLGCVRCHQRDSDQPSPLEAVGSTLGGAWLQNVPFQKMPRLTHPHQKYTPAHLTSVVREGVTGLRSSRYTYKMPAFGRDAEAAVQALAEADGDLPTPEPPTPRPDDPTLATLHGPALVGFQGYGCVSCHVWNGKALADPDPGAVGTDLTRLSGRIRRDWFDRFVEGPARFHPGTPMPAIFEKGKPALLRSVLDGDAGRQREAMWAYFALGSKAPAPKPPPPLAIDAPRKGEPPLVAQIPVRLPDGTVVEALCLLYPGHDLIVHDLGSASLHSAFVGAQIQRGVQGRLRTFTVSGTAAGTFHASPAFTLVGGEKDETPEALTLHGYDRLADGARLRWQVRFASATVELVETLRLDGRRLNRELEFRGVPAERAVTVHTRGEIKKAKFGRPGVATVTLSAELPAARTPPEGGKFTHPDPGPIGGSLERPGYRAIVYPRPRTSTGEDRVMPGAVAVDPKDGRVFVASMKTGELLVLRDPTGDGRKATFDNYARGLFQECFSMLGGSDGLYLLHRRNLTRVVDTDRDGLADRFDRVAALPHGVADTYDYGYGLARDRTGAFVYTFAPYASTSLPGSGGALRLVPGKQPQEVAYGFRNPLGWCAGPEGEVFFTDNQGEWVATNKLCHLSEGRFYGFPNGAQKEHAKKPAGRTAVWVPYAWAKSINGVTYDGTGGKFGPFAGQLFLAELMFGGAIIRADVEKVNGEYQGACFPFWGPGLLGPVSLAFDPKGRLWVGGITEPGWMAQPDRGALFRIDYTGKVPFEMQSIRVRPRGFRITFTAPVSKDTARELASYRIDHHRYEYTGAYGSPELDRTRLAIEKVEVAEDGLSVELTTGPLVKGRVYMIEARGVRSASAEPLVYPTGAYTLNEIPTGK